MTNPLLRKVTELPKPRPDRYGSLGLTDNPFPLEPSLCPGTDDPRLNGTLYSEELTQDSAKDLERLLIPSRSRSNPVSIAFLMDYATRRGRGIGKSAFLRHESEKIMSDFGARASEDTGFLFAVHVTPPPGCRKFWEFCRTIGEALFEGNVVPKAVWRLRALSGAIPEGVLEQIGGSDEWENTIGNEQWLGEKGVDVTFTLNRIVENKIKAAGVPEELAHLLALSSGDMIDKGQLLSGLGDYRWRKDGARIIFNDMVNFFRAAGFTRGLLLIDEVEKIVYRQNMEERRTFVDSLRYYMFDTNSANARNRFYGMLLTIHPGVQELLISHWKAAGLDRLAPLAQPDAQQSTIYFGPLDEAMVRPLVKVYLDHYRSPELDRDTMEPFSQDALAEALVKSGGVPGPTLRLLHRVVERAVDARKTKVTRSLVKQVYSSDERLEPSETSDEDIPPTPRVDLAGR